MICSYLILEPNQKMQMNSSGKLKTGLDKINKCFKKEDCNPFGGNNNFNNFTIETKNSNSISVIRVLRGLSSTDSN